MEIGSKIRELRLKADLTQEELGDRCELTKGYISQLENDVTSPSIATLEDIVAALGTTLVELFSESQPEQSPVYRADDYFVKENDGYVTHWLIHNGVINEMEPILVEIKAGCSTDSDNPHEGEEFGFVLEGKMRLFIGNKSYELKKGDSFYFKSEKVHFLKNVGAKTAKILWVSSPPNF